MYAARIHEFLLQHFLAYGPDYQLDIPCGRKHDMNSAEDLVNLCKTVSGNKAETIDLVSSFYIYLVNPSTLMGLGVGKYNHPAYTKKKPISHSSEGKG